jgi:hypothetical protein
MRHDNQPVNTGKNTGAVDGRVNGMTSGYRNERNGKEESNEQASVKNILILSANPEDTGRLRLDKEVREIDEGLKRSKYRDRFCLHQKWAVTFWDLRRALMEYEPQIVHFAGHGTEEGLLVEGELGIPVPINKKALDGIFKLSARHVECVVLNACYSSTQVAVIKQHIKYVVGMQKKMMDGAAIEFSVGFYDALGAGRTVEDAFEYGCIAIDQIYPGLPDHSRPILK